MDIKEQDVFRQFVDTVAHLRSEEGCPWDREQTHESLKRYLLEESYEVLDALESGSDEKICDELGDVLLQVVLHAQIAKEQGRFDIDDVLCNVNDKMIRRHPHVFGDNNVNSSQEVLNLWENIKAAEKKEGEKKRIMKVNTNLPALMLAQKVQEKAGRVGFDWPDIEGPLDKLDEEIGELKAAKTREEKEEELGDCLFALVNVARFLDLDAEDSLRGSVKKVIRRFNYMEDVIESLGKKFEEFSLKDLDELWDEAKLKEV